MHAAANPIFILLLQVATVLLTGRVVGRLFRLMGQPHVVGEMIAGIALGPSMFGLLAPAAQATLFPAASVANLGLFSQAGVILFLFLIGLEVDPRLLKNRGQAAVVISHASILAPFLLGAALTLYLFPKYFQRSPHQSFTSAALFMGAAMSVTAFPVLARILAERNLLKTNVGTIAITCAAVDDVTAWCLLAFVVGIARADGFAPGLVTAGLAVGYVAVFVLGVRPLLRRLSLATQRQGGVGQGAFAAVMLVVLASAAATEWIGIHALFGAFLAGAMMPKDPPFVRAIVGKLEDLTIGVLLPIFFAYTGLKTQVGLLDGRGVWLDAVLIIAVACLGKWGGSMIAARACGIGWREASCIGVLMNTRGLMGLIILDVGLKEGVITPVVFAMMVVMAVVTTALTSPLLTRMLPAAERAAEAAGATAAAGIETILIPIAAPDSGPGLARLAAALVRPGMKTAVHALKLSKPRDAEILADAVAPIHAGAECSAAPNRPATIDDASFLPLLNEARSLNLQVTTTSRFASNIGTEIATFAELVQSRLVLMGFHKPVFGKAILGGIVHRVLESSERDVAIFVDRDSLPVKRILVPVSGSPNDALAAELGRQLAQAWTAELVEKPVRGSAAIDDLVAAARGVDLVVVGISEHLDLESQSIDFGAQEVAERITASLLIVRQGASP